ncbi:E3 ubiquitin-protein ligase ATL31-like protein [Drosera capensis]
MATGRHGNSIAAAAAAAILLVLLAAPPAASQPTSATDATDPYPYNPRFGPSIGIIIIILIFALLFMGFFSIYLRHCADSNSYSNHMIGSITTSARSRRSAQRKGLDPETISGFPTFVYEDVKALKIGKGALECAVCLNEFEDEETLSLIPHCDHVFHPECISAWLDGHVTCPVCRADLTKPTPQRFSESTPTITTQISDHGKGQSPSLRLTENREIDEESMEMPLRSPEVVELGQWMNRNRTRKDRSGRPRFYGRMNSTGHVAVKQWENMDRFTLRLPVEVRKQVMSGKLTRSTSCLFLREGSGSTTRRGVNRAVGPGREGSWRGGGWSGRWSGFFPRWNSMKLGGGGGSMRSRDDSVHSLRGDVSMRTAVVQLRACHKLTTKLKREVILGSSIFYDPPHFITKLKMLTVNEVSLYDIQI